MAQQGDQSDPRDGVTDNGDPSNNIAWFENNEPTGSGTASCTINSNPVITAILSQPGTFNTKAYSAYSFLVSDGTGSADVYMTSTQVTTLGYTPTVGDAITPSGTWYPYHQIPELETLTAITQVSTGNAVAAPAVSTIPTLNVATLPYNVAGYEFTLDDVTIGGISGTFGIANLTGTITDADSNSMTLYYWPTSYAASNINLYGQAIPTGPVDITGFVSVYPGPPASIEFTPISITPYATPEPGTVVMLGAGLAAAIMLFLHRKKVSG